MWGNLDKNQIEDLLKSELVGRIGCSDNDKIYVVPVTYAYENGYIFGHTKDGLKIHIMRDNPNVCFEIDWVKDLSNWKSVIAFGTFEELEGSEANNGLEILMEKIKSYLSKNFLPTKTQIKENINIENFAFQQSFLSPFLHTINKQITNTVVYRIKINEVTGKFGNEVEPVDN